ncbi:MAG: Wadjet anti-phage system protein JetD domain-containing protein [Thiohalomonadales bacterium]
MKSPEQLAEKLIRQWQHADTRELRLLNPDSWPLRLSIGKPSASALTNELDLVRKHLETWRKVQTGKIEWEKLHYRSTSEAVEIPVAWQLAKPSEWIEATRSKVVKREFDKLAKIISAVDPMFQSLLIRQRQLVIEKPVEQVIKACELALLLEPGCANHAPLRALTYPGIDSKFFERNRGLICKLLDIRLNGLANEVGLEELLGAINENDHWLLVLDLDGELLPFKQLRVRDSELIKTPLPASKILIVENERCVHQLPRIQNAVAILGAGLNLSWISAAWLDDKQIAYWGDIDTWGLTMLARARQQQPLLKALLMSKDIYAQFRSKSAVPELKTAGTQPPNGLTAQERQLYLHLLTQENGRLEQEFLPRKLTENSVLAWGNHLSCFQFDCNQQTN